MRATTVRRAFFLNAFVAAAIAALSIELRRFVDIREETRDLPRASKVTLTAAGAFVVALVIYLTTRFVFGFGGGMLASAKRSPYFF